MQENKKLKYVGPSFGKVVLASEERIAACDYSDIHWNPTDPYNPKGGTDWTERIWSGDQSSSG
jgi:hypothetical protein